MKRYPYGWIDTVFWSLILTGAGITLINEAGQCIACQIGNRFKLPWFEAYCT